MLEIERKFLVYRLPDDLACYENLELQQGYLSSSENGSEVRLRSENARRLLTVKTSGGVARSVYETELTAVQFDALWPATSERRIRKTRYNIAWKVHVIELDLFHDQLEGLAVAEVEFDSVDDSQAFIPPDWFGREVTDQEEFKNRNLAIFGWPVQR